VTVVDTSLEKNRSVSVLANAGLLTWYAVGARERETDWHEQRDENPEHQP
jgi:hypothetical protein